VEQQVNPTPAEVSCWKPKETNLLFIPAAEWLDKHACSDGEGKRWGCCG
jgi:hypothetical protein